ncbi:MAG: P1 family peptidase [Microthrixaceae bacterium]
MIDAIEGLRVGHVTHSEACTGCTVVLADARSPPPGRCGQCARQSRVCTVDLMATVQSIDAVALSGGSAFGLAVGDGVMQWLDDQGRGFPTPWGRVPIVVGMSLFDLPVGDPSARPPQPTDTKQRPGQVVSPTGTLAGRAGFGVAAWSAQAPAPPYRSGAEPGR